MKKRFVLAVILGLSFAQPVFAERKLGEVPFSVMQESELAKGNLCGKQKGPKYLGDQGRTVAQAASASEGTARSTR